MIAMAILVLIVVFASFIVFGFLHFNQKVHDDKNSLFGLKGNTEVEVKANDIELLPAPLKAYLIRAGVLGQCKDCHAILKQMGSIRQKPNAGWIRFSATQYMTAATPGFVWHARSFPMFIRDKSINGLGEMWVSLFGFFTMARAKSDQIDQSALCRCLSELPLYPLGFLSPLIDYTLNEDGSVTAKLGVNGVTTQSTFYFDQDALIYEIRTKRYKEDTLENFTGKFEDYKVMKGLYIPTKLRAIWNLEAGDFEYFKCEIIEYEID